MTPVPFRFDAERHEYWALDTGEKLPHITGILEAAGRIDTRWFTQASRDRGTLVHDWTMDLDFKVLPSITDVSLDLRPYLYAYHLFTSIERPVMIAIEVPAVHSVFRFGGRIDRQVRMRKRAGVLEIKTGCVQRSHMLQTAMQAMLMSEETGIPPESLGRWTVYLSKVGKSGRGRFKLEEHLDPADFAEVRQILDEVLVQPGCEVDHDDIPF